MTFILLKEHGMLVMHCAGSSEGPITTVKESGRYTSGSEAMFEQCKYWFTTLSGEAVRGRNKYSIFNKCFQQGCCVNRKTGPYNWSGEETSKFQPSILFLSARNFNTKEKKTVELEPAWRHPTPNSHYVIMSFNGRLLLITLQSSHYLWLP